MKSSKNMRGKNRYSEQKQTGFRRWKSGKKWIYSASVLTLLAGDFAPATTAFASTIDASSAIVETSAQAAKSETSVKKVEESTAEQVVEQEENVETVEEITEVTPDTSVSEEAPAEEIEKVPEAEEKVSSDSEASKKEKASKASAETKATEDNPITSIEVPATAEGTVGEIFFLDFDLLRSDGSKVWDSVDGFSVAITSSPEGSTASDNFYWHNGLLTFTPDIPGEYTLTYTYTNPLTGEIIEATTIVTVANNPIVEIDVAATAEGTTGEYFELDFDLLRSDGSKVDNYVDADVFSVAITSSPEGSTASHSFYWTDESITFIPDIPGEYTLTSTYTNPLTGDVIRATTVVTVVNNPIVEIDVPATAEGIAGEDFGLDFDLLRSDGSRVDNYVDGFSVAITSSPEGSAASDSLYWDYGWLYFTPDIPGEYTLTYTYTNPLTGEVLEATTIVTAANNPIVEIDVPATAEGIAGEDFDLDFDLLRSDGSTAGNYEYDFSVAITSSPEGSTASDSFYWHNGWLVFTPDIPGEYTLTYTYTNPLTGEVLEATTIVTVVNNPIVEIDVPATAEGTVGEYFFLDFDLLRSDGSTAGNYGNALSVAVTSSPEGSTASDSFYWQNGWLSFTPDIPGEYTLTYTYTNPLTGEIIEATTVVTVVDNPIVELDVPATAEGIAGEDFFLDFDLLRSDGSSAYNSVDGFSVAITSAPEGSTASDSFYWDSVWLYFIPDIPGEYTLTYTYTNPLTGEVLEATTVVKAANNPIVEIDVPATAEGTTGEYFELDFDLLRSDGSKVEGYYIDALSVAITSSPEGSTASDSFYWHNGWLGFTPDIPGEYTLTYTYTNPLTGEVLETTTIVTVVDSDVAPPTISEPTSSELSETASSTNGSYTFNPTDQGVVVSDPADDSAQATVKVVDGFGNSRKANSDGSYSLIAGTYTVTYSYPNAKSVTQTVIVAPAQTTIDSLSESDLNLTDSLTVELKEGEGFYVDSLDIDLEALIKDYLINKYPNLKAEIEAGNISATPILSGNTDFTLLSNNVNLEKAGSYEVVYGLEGLSVTYTLANSGKSRIVADEAWTFDISDLIITKTVNVVASDTTDPDTTDPDTTDPDTTDPDTTDPDTKNPDIKDPDTKNPDTTNNNKVNVNNVVATKVEDKTSKSQLPKTGDTAVRTLSLTGLIALGGAGVLLQSKKKSKKKA